MSAPPLLRLVGATLAPPTEWTWFCGHCAAPSPGGRTPGPRARVCRECGLGLLLETPGDAAPSSTESYLVIDSSLLVQAVSRTAERLLCVREDAAVNRPLGELLVAADADSSSRVKLAATIAEAADGHDQRHRVHVRPANTFGVRLRARVAPCGPPRAALLVLDRTQPLGPHSL